MSTPEQTPLELRIEAARREDYRELDLSDLDLDRIPRRVFLIPHLEKLVLGGQLLPADCEEIHLAGLAIPQLPPVIGMFTNLLRLDLSGNRLSSLPKEIESLKRLQELHLEHNEFLELPCEIWRLPHLREITSDQQTGIQSLTRLDLSNQNLTALPPAIGSLRELQVLKLGKNQLRSLPDEIGDLTSLTVLDLQDNSLTALPEGLCRLAHLTTLNLKGNRLTSLPEKFGDLQHLDILNLRENRWSSFPKTIWQLRRLSTLDSGHDWRELDLSDIGLTALPPIIWSFKTVERLDASGNRLNSLPPDIRRLKNLSTLRLDRNQFETMPSEICSLPNLRTLGFANNRLETLPTEISGLAHLVSLDLAENHVWEIPAELSRCTHLASLDLSRNELESVPPPIWETRSIEALNLEGNRLTSIPSDIGKLSNLTTLRLKDNQLHSLPPEIGALRKLAFLDLACNRLMSLPPEIGKLESLVTLRAETNQLHHIPPEIGTLAQLSVLNLRSNTIFSLPSELCQLTNLTDLILASNQLEVLPRQIGQLARLRTLDASNNRLHSIPVTLGGVWSLQTIQLAENHLSDTIVSLANRGANSLLSYLRSLEREGRPLYEAKLVLVGEGNVGKTSLLAALRNEQFIEGRPTTHGMEVNTLDLPHPKLGETITLNTWDFGGQPVYRVTHQFFFSQRSLYLLVWSPREGPEKNDVEGWIKRIRLRVGDQARILVVSTHCDTGRRVSRIDASHYQRTFGRMIFGFYEIDSKTGSGIDNLKKAIGEAASELPQMGEFFNIKWKAARDEVLALRRKQPQITSSLFKDICRQHGLDEKDISTLGGLLHDLGHVVYFAEDDGLANVIVLQPEWLTKAIGFVLEDRETYRALGVLAHSELNRIWNRHGIADRERYEPELHPFFLRLMEKFDVSYRFEEGGKSLIAQLVSDTCPALAWYAEDSADQGELVLACQLSGSPPGLIPWMIVRTHRYTTGKHWQGGMFLDYAIHGTALLELHDDDLTITVRGEDPSHFMSLLSDTFELLVRKRWPGLTYKLSVPCPLKTDAGERCTGRLRLDVLRKRRSAKLIHMSCPDCGADLDINKLLTGFATPTLDIEERLQEVKVRLDYITRQGKAQASHAAQMLRVVLQSLSSETGQCPHLFSLVPEELSRWNPLHFNRARYRLTLWCQFPDGEHPLCPIGGGGDGEYVFRRQQQWFAKIAPYVLLLARILRHTIPVAGGAVRLLLEQVQLKEIGPKLDLMEKVATSILKLSVEDMQSDRGLERLAMPDEIVAVRELHALLTALDPSRRWGGLRRVYTPTGDYLWLCPIHYRVFDPGLPKLS